MFWMLLLALPQDVPPPPSGRTLPVGAVEIVDPIAPMVRRFTQCIYREMRARGAMPEIRAATYRRDVDASIAACAAVKASAMAEAEAALSQAPDYRDPQRRQQAIRHAFDGTERQQRDMLEIMEVIRRERRPEN